MDITETEEWLKRYQIYLQSTAWKDRRERVLEYWGYKCATCFSEYDLHVHHRTYKRVGAEKFTDLIPLCENCHAKFHETLGRQAGPDRPQTVREVTLLWRGMTFDGIEK